MAPHNRRLQSKRAPTGATTWKNRGPNDGNHKLNTLDDAEEEQKITDRMRDGRHYWMKYGSKELNMSSSAAKTQFQQMSKEEKGEWHQKAKEHNQTLEARSASASSQTPNNQTLDPMDFEETQSMD